MHYTSGVVISRGLCRVVNAMIDNNLIDYNFSLVLFC
jgi:hypothetical protein